MKKLSFPTFIKDPSFLRLNEFLKLFQNGNSFKPGEKNKDSLFQLAGRVKSIRKMSNKLCFANIQSDFNRSIQIVLQNYDINSVPNIGDCIGSLFN